MNCLYRRTKYYEDAKVDASQVIEPIGFVTKKELQKKQAQKSSRYIKYNQLFVKFIVQNTLFKLISSKHQHIRDVKKNIKVQKALQRKNYCLNGVNLDFVTSANPQQMQQLREAWKTDEKDEKKLLPYLQLLSLMGAWKDGMLQLKNFAISTYMVYYEGSNISFYKYLQSYLDEHLIQYNNQFLISSPELQRPQLRKIQFYHKQSVEDYINEIVHIGQIKDRFFTGIHLYICDTLPAQKSSGHILREEIQYWSYLHSQLAIATATLEEGHHAYIKISGTYTQRTIQYLYLAKMSFSRVSLCKWIGSNAFSNQKYLICEGLVKENGRYVSKYLLDNFEEVLRQKQNVNIVQFRAVFQNDFHANINDFNNSLPIIKLSKEKLKEIDCLDKYEYYPNRQKLIAKIQKIPFPLDEIEEIKLRICELVPSSQSQKLDKVPLITQKQATELNVEQMVQVFNSTLQTKKAKKEVRNKHLFDLQDQYRTQDFSSLIRVAQKPKTTKQKKKKRTED